MSETEEIVTQACWNTIGVWGHESAKCERLSQVTHCRNCSVYCEAGRTVFERNTPAKYIDEWTLTLARAKEEVSPVSESIIYFRLNEEWFSLSTKAFMEVSEIKKIHSIPHQSGNLIVGFVNINGSVKVCFSLAYVLGVSQSSGKDSPDQIGIYSRYIVTKTGKSEFVFPVDEVGGVYRYDPEELKQVPATVETDKAKLLSGVLKINDKEIACIKVDELAATIEGMIGE